MPSLALDSPIVAAPMAGGPTTPALLRAVAGAGSLGFLPAGYRSAAQLADDLDGVRDLGDLLGVNLFVPDPRPVDREALRRYRDLVAAEVEELGSELGPEVLEDDDDWDAKLDLLVREPVPWVSFTFGLPDPRSAERLRAAGPRLLATVTCLDEARAAADLGVDGLIAQAAAAGGHRGTFDQHREPGAEALGPLVHAVRTATGLPVVAAGGIGDAAAVRAALDSGAEAVSLGTALLLTDEAGTRPTHRAALGDRSASTVPTRVWTGRVARALRTTFTDRYDAAAPAAYPAVHHLTAPMRRWAAEHDDREHLHLWAGTAFRSVRPGPARDVVAALTP